MFKRFGHIGIAAKDPEKLCRWYCDVLGFKVIFEIPKTERRPIPIYFIQLGTKTTIEIIPATDRERIKRDTNDPCLLYTSPSPRDISGSRMPSSA